MAVETLLRTALAVLILPLGMMLLSAGAVVAAWLGASQRRLDFFYRTFARLCRLVGGTRLVVHGLENADPEQAYVIVANHESNWDPFMLVAAFPGRSIRFVVKKSIIQIPVFGRALLATGNVMVDRANTREDIERIRSGMHGRPLEVSVLFYAEGTRSRDGALAPFKKGAFVSALAYGLPVLPVGHAGAYRIWTPLTPWIRRNPMVIEVGTPIPVADLTLEDRDKLRDQARDAVGELRSRARRAVRELGGETGGID
jgi:1-acyl-sn-glycerol-3-phosphate acyltransferase